MDAAGPEVSHTDALLALLNKQAAGSRPAQAAKAPLDGDAKAATQHHQQLGSAPPPNGRQSTDLSPLNILLGEGGDAAATSPGRRLRQVPHPLDSLKGWGSHTCVQHTLPCRRSTASFRRKLFGQADGAEDAQDLIAQGAVERVHVHPLSRFRNIWDTITLGEPSSLNAHAHAVIEHKHQHSGSSLLCLRCLAVLQSCAYPSAVRRWTHAWMQQPSAMPACEAVHPRTTLIEAAAVQC